MYIGRVRPTETTSQVTRDPFTGDGVTVDFTLSRAPANEQSIIVTLGGVVQHDSAYSIINGTTLRFVTAPDNGVEIEARIISDVGVGYLPPENSLEGRHLVPNSIGRDRLQTFNLGNSPRQTVLAGGVDSNGYANFISIGTGLSCNLAATSTPIILSYANGFDTGGAVDYLASIDTDVVGYWSGLTPSNVNYLYVDRNPTTGALSTYQSVLPPQYGYAFDKTRQVLLHFEGTDGSTTITDEYGNTWTVGGNAQIDTAQFKFGTASLLCDGTGDYIECLNFSILGNPAWTVEGYVRFNALPASTVAVQLFNAVNAGAFGAKLQLYNNAGTYQLRQTLSSNGTSNDIASAVAGAITTPSTGVWYHWVLTYDPVAGKYYSYWDGTKIVESISTANIHGGITQVRVGATDTGTNPLNGWMDEFRFSPCCRYPAGTTFTPPSSPFTPDAEWFDINEFKWKYGSPSSWTEKQRLQIGLCSTGAATVSSVTSAALRGKCKTTNQPFADATLVTMPHNIVEYGSLLKSNVKFIINKDVGAFNTGTVYLHQSIAASEGGAQTPGAGYFIDQASVIFRATDYRVEVPGAGIVSYLHGYSSSMFAEVERGW